MLSFIFSTFSIAHLTISYNFSALAKSVSTISTAHKSNVITLGRGQQCFQRVLELILSSYRRWKMTTTGSSKTSVTESVVNWASVADRISSTSSWISELLVSGVASGSDGDWARMVQWAPDRSVGQRPRCVRRSVDQ